MTRLAIELVPSTCWFSNVRSEVTRKVWDTLRRQVYAEASNACEICGGQGRRHPVECHEDWHYDDATKVQTLRRMLALCPACHEVKHFGLAEKRGRGQAAFNHLRKVNGWSIDEAVDHLSRGILAHRQRSLHEWTLDISFLREFGVSA